MSQQELLSRVTRGLDDLRIDYMVTGSFASSIQGEPRLTHDIDLVVALTWDEADKLVEAFPDAEFYLSVPAMREAIERRGMFNVIHMGSFGTVAVSSGKGVADVPHIPAALADRPRRPELDPAQIF